MKKRLFYIGGIIAVSVVSFFAGIFYVNHSAVEKAIESRAVQGCEIAAIQVHHLLQVCEYGLKNSIAANEECDFNLQRQENQTKMCNKALMNLLSERDN